MVGRRNDQQYEQKYGPLAIFDISPSVGRSFAQNVCNILGVPLQQINVDKFRDGETDIKITESVRGKDVYVFQSYIPPLGERLYELQNFLDAVTSGGSASRVTVVFPYTFGSRGERRTKARQPIPTLVVARALKENGAKKVLTVGIHTTTIGSTYNAVGIEFEHLEFEHLAANYILNTAEGNVVIAAPDVGAASRIRRIRKIIMEEIPAHIRRGINLTLAIADKYRPAENVAEIWDVVGDVKDKIVYIVDDIGDTLGTLKEAAKAYRKKGAKKIYVIINHPVLSPGSEQNLTEILANGIVDEIVFGNTIPLKEFVKNNPKIKIIPIEPFVAEAIRRLHADRSISGLHKYEEIVRAYQNGAQATLQSMEFISKNVKKESISLALHLHR